MSAMSIYWSASIDQLLILDLFNFLGLSLHFHLSPSFCGLLMLLSVLTCSEWNSSKCLRFLDYKKLKQTNQCHRTSIIEGLVEALVRVGSREGRWIKTTVCMSLFLFFSCVRGFVFSVGHIPLPRRHSRENSRTQAKYLPACRCRETPQTRWVHHPVTRVTETEVWMGW